MDLLQDTNGHALVVFPDHSSQTKNINEPPEAKPTHRSPEDEIQPDLP